MEKIKIGLAGASWFADLWYVPVLLKHPHVELAAVCSAGGDSARRMAEKYGIASAYDSYSDMFERAGIDGVCVVTPNDVHASIATAAMERGIHVICEKPLAATIADAAAMVRTAERTKIVHGVNFTYREHPGVRKLKAMAEGGDIGSLHSGIFEYTGDYGIAGPPGWRGSSSVGGAGGVLGDLGSHLIDLARFVTGERLTETVADARFAHRGQSPDSAADAVVFLGRHERGAIGSFRTSWLDPQGARGQTIRIALIGDLGKLDFAASHFGASLTYAKTGQPAVAIDLASEVEAWDEAVDATEERFRPWRVTERNEVWKWIDRIRDHKAGRATPHADAPTFLDGYYVQAVMEAVMKSAEQKRWAVV